MDSASIDSFWSEGRREASWWSVRSGSDLTSGHDPLPDLDLAALQVVLTQLDHSPQKGKASIGRSGALSNRRPPSRGSRSSKRSSADSLQLLLDQQDLEEDLVVPRVVNIEVQLEGDTQDKKENREPARINNFKERNFTFREELQDTLTSQTPSVREKLSHSREPLDAKKEIRRKLFETRRRRSGGSVGGSNPFLNTSSSEAAESLRRIKDEVIRLAAKRKSLSDISSSWVTSESGSCTSIQEDQRRESLRKWSEERESLLDSASVTLGNVEEARSSSEADVVISDRESIADSGLVNRRTVIKINEKKSKSATSLSTEDSTPLWIRDLQTRRSLRGEKGQNHSRIIPIHIDPEFDGGINVSIVSQPESQRRDSTSRMYVRQSDSENRPSRASAFNVRRTIEKRQIQQERRERRALREQIREQLRSLSEGRDRRDSSSGSYVSSTTLSQNSIRSKSMSSLDQDQDDFRSESPLFKVQSSPTLEKEKEGVRRYLFGVSNLANSSESSGATSPTSVGERLVLTGNTSDHSSEKREVPEHKKLNQPETCNWAQSWDSLKSAQQEVHEKRNHIISKSVDSVQSYDTKDRSSSPQSSTVSQLSSKPSWRDYKARHTKDKSRFITDVQTPSTDSLGKSEFYANSTIHEKALDKENSESPAEKELPPDTRPIPPPRRRKLSLSAGSITLEEEEKPTWIRLAKERRSLRTARQVDQLSDRASTASKEPEWVARARKKLEALNVTLTTTTDFNSVSSHITESSSAWSRGGLDALDDLREEASRIGEELAEEASTRVNEELGLHKDTSKMLEHKPDRSREASSERPRVSFEAISVEPSEGGESNRRIRTKKTHHRDEVRFGDLKHDWGGVQTKSTKICNGKQKEMRFGEVQVKETLPETPERVKEMKFGKETCSEEKSKEMRFGDHVKSSFNQKSQNNVETNSGKLPVMRFGDTPLNLFPAGEPKGTQSSSKFESIAGPDPTKMTAEQLNQNVEEYDFPIPTGKEDVSEFMRFLEESLKKAEIVPEVVICEDTRPKPKSILKRRSVESVPHELKKEENNEWLQKVEHRKSASFDWDSVGKGADASLDIGHTRNNGHRVSKEHNNFHLDNSNIKVRQSQHYSPSTITTTTTSSSTTATNGSFFNVKLRHVSSNKREPVTANNDPLRLHLEQSLHRRSHGAYFNTERHNEDFSSTSPLTNGREVRDATLRVSLDGSGESHGSSSPSHESLSEPGVRLSQHEANHGESNGDDGGDLHSKEIKKAIWKMKKKESIDNDAENEPENGRRKSYREESSAAEQGRTSTTLPTARKTVTLGSRSVREILQRIQEPPSPAWETCRTGRGLATTEPNDGSVSPGEGQVAKPSFTSSSVTSVATERHQFLHQLAEEEVEEEVLSDELVVDYHDKERKEMNMSSNSCKTPSECSSTSTADISVSRQSSDTDEKGLSDSVIGKDVGDELTVMTDRECSIAVVEEQCREPETKEQESSFFLKAHEVFEKDSVDALKENENAAKENWAQVKGNESLSKEHRECSKLNVILSTAHWTKEPEMALRKQDFPRQRNEILKRPKELVTRVSLESEKAVICSAESEISYEGKEAFDQEKHIFSKESEVVVQNGNEETKLVKEASVEKRCEESTLTTHTAYIASCQLTPIMVQTPFSDQPTTSTSATDFSGPATTTSTKDEDKDPDSHEDDEKQSVINQQAADLPGRKHSAKIFSFTFSSDQKTPPETTLKDLEEDSLVYSKTQKESENLKKTEGLKTFTIITNPIDVRHSSSSAEKINLNGHVDSPVLTKSSPKKSSKSLKVDVQNEKANKYFSKNPEIPSKPSWMKLVTQNLSNVGERRKAEDRPSEEQKIHQVRVEVIGDEDQTEKFLQKKEEDKKSPLLEWEALQRQRLEDEEKNRINKNLSMKPVSTKIKEMVKNGSFLSMFTKDKKTDINGTVDGKDDIVFRKMSSDNCVSDLKIEPLKEVPMPMKSPYIVRKLLSPMKHPVSREETQEQRLSRKDTSKVDSPSQRISHAIHRDSSKSRVSEERSSRRTQRILTENNWESSSSNREIASSASVNHRSSSSPSRNRKPSLRDPSPHSAKKNKEKDMMPSSAKILIEDSKSPSSKLKDKAASATVTSKLDRKTSPAVPPKSNDFSEKSRVYQPSFEDVRRRHSKSLVETNEAKEEEIEGNDSFSYDIRKSEGRSSIKDPKNRKEWLNKMLNTLSSEHFALIDNKGSETPSPSPSGFAQLQQNNSPLDPNQAQLTENEQTSSQDLVSPVIPIRTSSLPSAKNSSPEVPCSSPQKISSISLSAAEISSSYTPTSLSSLSPKPTTTTSFTKSLELLDGPVTTNSEDQSPCSTPTALRSLTRDTLKSDSSQDQLYRRGPVSLSSILGDSSSRSSSLTSTPLTSPRATPERVLKKDSLDLTAKLDVIPESNLRNTHRISLPIEEQKENIAPSPGLIRSRDSKGYKADKEDTPLPGASSHVRSSFRRRDKSEERRKSVETDHKRKSSIVENKSEWHPSTCKPFTFGKPSVTLKTMTSGVDPKRVSTSRNSYLTKDSTSESSKITKTPDTAQDRVTGNSTSTSVKKKSSLEGLTSKDKPQESYFSRFTKERNSQKKKGEMSSKGPVSQTSQDKKSSSPTRDPAPRRTSKERLSFRSRDSPTRSTPDKENNPISLSAILSRNIDSKESVHKESSRFQFKPRLSFSEELNDITLKYRKDMAVWHSSSDVTNEENPSMRSPPPTNYDSDDVFDKSVSKRISTPRDSSLEPESKESSPVREMRNVNKNRSTTQEKSSRKKTSREGSLEPSPPKSLPKTSSSSGKSRNRVVRRNSSLKRNRPEGVNSSIMPKKERKDSEDDPADMKSETVVQNAGGWTKTKTTVRRARLGSSEKTRQVVRTNSGKNRKERSFKADASKALEDWAAGTRIQGKLMKKEGQRFSHETEEEVKGGQRTSRSVARRVVRRGSRRLSGGGELLTETKETATGGAPKDGKNQAPEEEVPLQRQEVLAIDDGLSRKMKTSTDGERYMTQSVLDRDGKKTFTTEGVNNKTTNSVEVIGGDDFEAKREVQGKTGHRVVVERSKDNLGRPSTVVKKITSQSRVIITKTKRKSPVVV